MISESTIKKFEMKTKKLAWEMMIEGNYKRAYEIMKIGRETVQQVREYQYKHLQKESYAR